MALLIRLLKILHNQKVAEFIKYDLAKASDILSKWFCFMKIINNYLKANPDKYHAFLTETSATQLRVQNVPIGSSSCENILRINIDQQLPFKPHVVTPCKQASQKLNLLSQMASSGNCEQRKFLLNAYAPVIWMFHFRKLNNQINHKNQRALRVVHNNYTSSFDELLLKDNSFTIHLHNLQNENLLTIVAIL